MNRTQSPWPADPVNESEQKRVEEILLRYPFLRDHLNCYLIFNLDSQRAAVRQLRFLYPEIFDESPSNYANPPIEVPVFSARPDISRVQAAREQWDTFERHRPELLRKTRFNRSGPLEREYEVASRECEIAKHAFSRETKPIIEWYVQEHALRETHYRERAREKWGADWQTRIPKR